MHSGALFVAAPKLPARAAAAKMRAAVCFAEIVLAQSQAAPKLPAGFVGIAAAAVPVALVVLFVLRVVFSRNLRILRQAERIFLPEVQLQAAAAPVGAVGIGNFAARAAPSALLAASELPERGKLAVPAKFAVGLPALGMLAALAGLLMFGAQFFAWAVVRVALAARFLRHLEAC